MNRLLWMAIALVLVDLAWAQPLRVCTTGDYPPITYIKHGRFHGTAIVQAKALGRFLNRPVQFVKVTRPMLESAVKAGRCDIAMGGIAKTPERVAHFLLTRSVAQFGKVPLIRCEDKNHFTDFATIDRPGVRVVENIGGTNASFSKQHIHHAKIILVKDNAQTFEYLLQGKADVMFTDTIEANYRHHLSPKLCVVQPKHLLTHSEKVYLLPKQSQPLLKRVNRFILQQQHKQ